MTEYDASLSEDQSAFPFMGEVPVTGPRYRVGIIGATGAVGGALLRVLKERHFPIGELRVFASQSSRGKWIESPFGPLMIEQLSKRRVPELDFAFLAAGSETARHWAWRLARKGAKVVDKSPYFRDKAYAPLIVPEVNAGHIQTHRGIISNPNCTTIPLVTALNPLHQKYGLKRVTAVTFQSVSGAGKKGITALGREIADNDAEPSAFTHRIAYNVIPWIGKPGAGHSGEESKMVAEARKILGLPRLSIQTTCVRVPTLVGHGLAIHAEFRRSVPIEAARQILAIAPGVALLDDPTLGDYPTPLAAAGRDEVFVGRLRRDRGPNCIAMFVVADNLRKGAATNAVQIAELLLNQNSKMAAD